MRLVFGIISGSALLAILSTISGCPAPPRGCGGCTYKAVTFSAVPINNIESASIKASVKHIGACPQSRYPDDCTEVLSYNTMCVGGANITIPMLIDAAPTNPNRSAKLSVKLVGNPTPIVITGVVATGTGTTTLPTTPCAPPTIDPYVTLPNVQ